MYLWAVVGRLKELPYMTEHVWAVVVGVTMKA
jgi:hypothetical protein